MDLGLRFAANDWVALIAAVSAVPLRLGQEVDELLIVSIRVVLVVEDVAVREDGAHSVQIIRGLTTL